MPHICIYTHINKEFTIQRHIKAYKGDTNIYGPLWTPTCICAMWTFFFIILYVFPSLFLSKKTLSSLISSTIIWQTFPTTTASCMTSPPYILLFTQDSPVICKNFSPLVYMYKSSRYFAVFHIDLGPMFPQSNTLSLETGSTAAFKHFGLYCQWLPGLTTKSIHYYLHSYHYHTRFTSITLRIPPLMLSSHFVPLDPLAPKLMTWLSAGAQIPMTQWLARIDY